MEVGSYTQYPYARKQNNTADVKTPWLGSTATWWPDRAVLGSPDREVSIRDTHPHQSTGGLGTHRMMRLSSTGLADDFCREDSDVQTSASCLWAGLLVIPA